MRKLNLSDITQYVEENIGTFHQERIAGLNDLKSRLPAALTYPLWVSEYVSAQRTFTIKSAVVFILSLNYWPVLPKPLLLNSR